MNERKEKERRTKSKEYQKESKRKQNKSIILRTHVYMVLLNGLFEYSFVVSKPKKISRKTMNYYPIEKIYDKKNKEIFDKEKIKTKNNINKERFLRKLCIERMMEELKEQGVEIKTKQTKKSKEAPDGLVPISLVKPISIIMNKENNKMEYMMEEMENSIGMYMNEYLEKIFEGKEEKIEVGNMKESKTEFRRMEIRIKYIENDISFSISDGEERNKS